MGWNPFSSATTTRADAVRTGAAAPTRSERALCWAARDRYFACLDAHSIVDAARDDAAARRACPAETADFERDCAAAWVRYFKQWRVADLQKRRSIERLEREGAVQVPIDDGSSPPPGGTTTTTTSASPGGNVAARKGPLPKSQASLGEMRAMLEKTRVEGGDK